MGCHTLLQGIFSSQGSNLGLPQADSLSSELLGPHKIHDDCLSPPDLLVHLPRPFFQIRASPSYLGSRLGYIFRGHPHSTLCSWLEQKSPWRDGGTYCSLPFHHHFGPKVRRRYLQPTELGGGAPGPQGHVLLPDPQQLWPLRKVRPKEGQGRTTVQFRAQALIESENKDPAVLGPPGQPLCGLGLAQRLTMLICKGACFLGPVWQHKGLFCRPASGQFRGAS